MSTTSRKLDDLLPTDLASFSPDAWALELAQKVNRRIQFVSGELVAGVFGARVIILSQDNQGQPVATEYIALQEDLPAVQREHTKTHELAHIALGHKTLVLTSDEIGDVRQKLWEQIKNDPTVCCRAEDPDKKTLSLEQDQEAEDLARLIYKRVFEARQRFQLQKNSSLVDWDIFLRRYGIG